MAEMKAEEAKSSAPELDGLTPLHLAVLKGSYAHVRWIVHEREYGVNALTADKITPLMLAALYGRSDIFLLLWGKKASPNSKDSHGYTLLDYAEPRFKFFQNLLHQCNKIASRKPDTGGRRDIYRVLKGLQVTRRRTNMRRTQEHAAAQQEARAQSRPQAPAHMNQISQQQSVHDLPRRAVFLPSSDGKQLEFVEGRCVAANERTHPARKCIGVILGVDGSHTDMFAVSGWGVKRDGTVASTNTLDNTIYTGLMMRAAPLLNFKLPANGAVFHVSGTEELTEDTVALLKGQLGILPPGLRETVIHLNHEVACRNCLRFLEVLNQKTGLVFRVEFHKWYTEVKRKKTPQLWIQPDGSARPVTGAPYDSGADENAELIDDELGLLDGGDDTATGLHDDPADPQQGDNVNTRTDPTTPRKRTSHRSTSAPERVSGPDYPKEGSAVSQEPPYDSYPYPKLYVTPPSRNVQALPTPQSLARINELSRRSTPPSPAGLSEGMGSQNQPGSMSPLPSQEWEVEDIVATEERDGARWFLVKWRGFPDENDTWESESNLANAQEAVSKFMEELRAIQS
ncbi:hypothetical protein KVR01_013055 [Diaporthe batatas]|uniref:uncharacterized protein n=1 Tax=Diaporthe batatas TaxID=748121 RepID=UPI001D040AB9|nr:uncharacterized protein KVR01_013055 [Diaporthe batatas]KAG8157065.1 hypothetical protein KVR01_013055 [Diaporthe batatas]